MKLLGGACLFLELLLHSSSMFAIGMSFSASWFTGPIVYGLVSNRCAGSSEFMGVSRRG